MKFPWTKSSGETKCKSKHRQQTEIVVNIFDEIVNLVDKNQEATEGNKNARSRSSTS